MLCQNRLGVELHANDRSLLVLDSHDDTSFCLARDDQVGWQCRAINDQRVVSADGKRAWHGLINAGIMMKKKAGSTMHRLRAARDRRTEGGGDRLMTEAHSQHRYRLPKFANHVQGTTGFVRCAGARRQDDGCGRHLSNGVSINRIVTNDLRLLSQSLEVASEVEDEAVVIVDQ